MYYCCSFEEIAETCVPKGSAVQLVLTSGVRFLLYSHRANQIHSMIEKYCLDNEKVGRKLNYFMCLHSGLISWSVNGMGKSAMHSQVLSSFNSTSCVSPQLNLSLILLRVLREDLGKRELSHGIDVIRIIGNPPEVKPRDLKRKFS